MAKPKQPKTKDPVKLAQMRERMAKARAAREEKRNSEAWAQGIEDGTIIVETKLIPLNPDALVKVKILEGAAEENGGPILPPPVESDPSPAAPSGDVMTSFSGITEGEPITSIRAGLANIMPDASIEQIVAETDAEYEQGKALDSLTGGDANANRELLPAATVAAPSSDPIAAAPPTEWPSYMPVAHGEREFQVIQMPQNPRLVICRDPAYPDQKFHVDVGNNENFALGMTLKAIPKPAPENAFWKLMGPLPRYKGRY